MSALKELLDNSIDAGVCSHVSLTASMLYVEHARPSMQALFLLSLHQEQPRSASWWAKEASSPCKCRTMVAVSR